MSTAMTLYDAVRKAWAPIPAPPAEDLKFMAWGWGEEAWHAFVNVAPMDVDIRSAGFYAATPLLDIPSRAAAAYLGPYLLSLLQHLDFQKNVGIFYDCITRAHTLTCLLLPSFWEEVIRPFLPSECRQVLVEVVAFLASEREALPLTQEQADTMVALAAEP